MSSDKQQIHTAIRKLRSIRTWQLVVILGLFLYLSATFLRLNNVGMVQRRDAVLAADEQGVSEDDIRARLFDLQRYVNVRMNADTGVFYLAGQYSRDTQKIVDQINNLSGGQSVNAKAEAICKPQFTHYTYAYTECMLNEILRQRVVDPADIPKKPSPDLYKHEYTAPLFSWDFAGTSILISIVILLVIITRGASLLLLKMLLKRHYRGI